MSEAIKLIYKDGENKNDTSLFVRIKNMLNNQDAANQDAANQDVANQDDLDFVQLDLNEKLNSKQIIELNFCISYLLKKDWEEQKPKKKYYISIIVVCILLILPFLFI